MIGAARGLKDCDIIMKGGITSGVVYPKAILRLSERYRFRSIGGTSAGAIAAAITAAAEYNRDGGGYQTIAGLPEELQNRLLTLFQPSPELRRVFESTVLVIAGQKGASLRKIIVSKWPYLISGLFGGLVLAIVAVWLGSYLGAFLLFLIGTVIGLAFLVCTVVYETLHDLVHLDFGFCPGPTQSYGNSPGLNDWLAEKIEVAAGRMTAGKAPPEIPLTFNDIWLGKRRDGSDEKRAIDLRMMTTNLSLRRPNALPHMDANHFFKKEEFARLFPAWVVNHMVADAAEKAEERKLADPNAEDDPPGYYRFPVGGDLPLIVAARMSLSFPILFSAVPLYRRDFPHEGKTGIPVMQRMLFSDGGLSSNFPVHFFDALLPNRPTFGISLEPFDKYDANRRVHLPMKAGSGIWLDCLVIESLPKFFMSLVHAAKDWQDRLQSTLPGYRERIASVYLKDEEGGLNLTMTPDQITTLTDLGERAGGLMIGAPGSTKDEQSFDFDDHRWRRYLVAFARIEQTLEQAAESWYRNTDPMRDFVEAYKPQSYHASPKQWRENVFERFDALMKEVKNWNGSSLRNENSDYIPKPQTVMRITPEH